MSLTDAPITRTTLTQTEIEELTPEEYSMFLSYADCVGPNRTEFGKITDIVDDLAHTDIDSHSSCTSSSDAMMYLDSTFGYIDVH